LRFAGVLVFLFAAAMASATDLTLDVQATRDQEAVYSLTDSAARLFGRNAARLTRRVRGAQANRQQVFSLPMRFFLTRGGSPLPPPGGRGRASDISLVFESTGPRAFPTEYRDFLQSVFQRARPVLDAVFGPPSVGGQVWVSNYDADIGERDAVAGGYYLPNNGSGRQEVRFPVYQDAVGFKLEVSAVNFIHTLLLAYMGPNSFGSDAFDEGLARAATMRISRTPAAMLANLDPDLIEGVLESTYDISPYYDWSNHPALGSSRFIAPNLRSQPLPIGGSVGGPYLLRYQMAGTAWQKVLVESPAFVAQLTQSLYASPGSYRTLEQQVALCQTVLNLVGGGTVEGLQFAQWYRRQFVLAARDVPGLKVIVQPFPIVDGLGGSDFGVFGIQAHYFSSDSAGNETLLSATSYPVFWTPEFFRLFTSVQDERMDIVSAYGAVAPNFPGDLFNSQPYRVVVDIPVQDRISRCILPAGSIATAARPNPNTFFGTVSGGPLTGTYTVDLRFGSVVQTAIPVSNLAFGARPDNAFLGSGVATIDVNRNGQRLLSRKVSKGPGPLGVDLRIGGDGTINLPGGLKQGVTMIGLPGDPFEAVASDVLGFPAAQTQAARWNGARNRYEFFPECGPMSQGLGFFVRSETAKPLAVQGRVLPNTAVAVALRPGWNLISTPVAENVPLSQVRVAVAANSPTSFNDARGVAIGTEFFSFTPGANDPVSGKPEGGTFNAATSFESGKAYYVRVFAPEGAVLSFSPSGLGGSGRSGGAPPPPGANAWEMRIALTGGGETSEVRIGQRSGATASFDPRYDADLPPRMGGLQGQSLTNLYRDMRKPLSREIYRIRFENLRVGTLYTVNAQRVSGSIGMVPYLDETGGMRGKFFGGGTYQFRAWSTSMTIGLGFNGARP